MLNTNVGGRREVPLWALGTPLIGVPVMVALLALGAPKLETPVDGSEESARTEQVERQAVDHASGLSTHCSKQPSSS